MAPLAGARSMIGEENASRTVPAPRERANGAENPEDFFSFLLLLRNVNQQWRSRHVEFCGKECCFFFYVIRSMITGLVEEMLTS